MTENYPKLTTAEKVELLEKILPMEVELERMAAFCKEKEEFGLCAKLTETRSRLMVERHNLTMCHSTTIIESLTESARRFLKLISG